MLYSGTEPESYITEYALVYEDNVHVHQILARTRQLSPMFHFFPEVKPKIDGLRVAWSAGVCVCPGQKPGPLSSEYGTHRTVRARLCP